MRKAVVAGFVGLGVLAGCSPVTLPVAALGNGKLMKGVATANINGDGEIIITGPYGTCTGNYNAYDTSTTLPISLLCQDGTTALGSATRTASGLSGSGTMTDSKGQDWRFVFGDNAASLF